VLGGPRAGAIGVVVIWVESERTSSGRFPLRLDESLRPHHGYWTKLAAIIDLGLDWKPLTLWISRRSGYRIWTYP
jgi:hypothetical protein